MVEGEDRAAARCPHHLSAFLFDDAKKDPSLRFPLVIQDERLAAELQPKRIDHERELRQDEIPFAHSERVCVRRSFRRKRGDDRLSSRPLIDAEEVILALPTKFQNVGVVATSGMVEVGVRGGDHSLDPFVIAVQAERVQRARVEANRHPRLGVGDDLAGQFVDADVAVIRERRREPGGHALEQSPARVGGELAPADPTCGRRLKVSLAAEVAVRVRDAARGEGELVQHGQPVEPVVVCRLLTSNLAGAVRTKVPVSQGGTVPRTGSSSRLICEARVVNPK